MDPSLISLIVTACLLLLSEVIPFLPVKANGVLHAVYLVLKRVYEKSVDPLTVEPLTVEPPRYSPSIPDGFQRNMVIS
jgi:hypothetical protein